jgi:hypothetical protein
MTETNSVAVSVSGSPSTKLKVSFELMLAIQSSQEKTTPQDLLARQSFPTFVIRHMMKL